MQFSGLKNSRAIHFFGAVALSLGLSQAAIAQEENIEVTPSTSDSARIGGYLRVI